MSTGGSFSRVSNISSPGSGMNRLQMARERRKAGMLRGTLEGSSNRAGWANTRPQTTGVDRKDRRWYRIREAGGGAGKAASE